MSLLRDIQNDAVNPSIDVPTLLRKCKVLAARLKNEEFSSWVENELNGYKSKDEVPEYRILKVQSYGHFSGPFGSGLKNAPIAAFSLPKELKHIANTAYLMEGVSSYSSLVKDKKNGTVMSHWPAEVVALYGDKMYENMNCIGAWRTIGTNQIQSVLDTVRNRVLSFVLEIEAEAPSAGEAQPGEFPIPNDKVNQIYQTYILGDVGNVSTGGSNITQVSFNHVEQGNMQSLTDYLQSLQIEGDDINELKDALKKDEEPKDKASLGKRVSAWLGKMVSKAATGVWKISSSVAAEVLSKAICNYYGLK